MQSRDVSLLVAACVAFGLGVFGCSGSQPPKGEQLRLRGAKGAQCTYDRECLSDKCEARQCTEKIDKVGLGKECTDSDGCLDGLRCDLRAKKCVPAVQCAMFRDKLERCVQDVYERFRPKQAGKLRRMRRRARKRFLSQIHGILYKGLCDLTRAGVSLKRGIALKKALEQSNCKSFASFYHAGAAKDG
ncbi:MAG: hypothetical protein ABI333_24390 [bacterium]